MSHSLALRSLDYSLQLAQTVSQSARFSGLLVNPCTLLGGQFETPAAATNYLRQLETRILGAQSSRSMGRNGSQGGEREGEPSWFPITRQ